MDSPFINIWMNRTAGIAIFTEKISQFIQGIESIEERYFKNYSIQFTTNINIWLKQKD